MCIGMPSLLSISENTRLFQYKINKNPKEEAVNAQKSQSMLHGGEAFKKGFPYT